MSDPPAARSLRGRPRGLSRGAGEGRLAGEGSDAAPSAPRRGRGLVRGGRGGGRAARRRGSRRGGGALRARERVPPGGARGAAHVRMTTYVKAINAALFDAMSADPHVIVLG